MILLQVFCFSQNLVLNGDFEDYSLCPDNYSYPNVIPYEITKCTNWSAPTRGTSDYFNACNNLTFSKIVGVPQNNLGFQNAYNGNAYVGAILYEFYADSIWWEYVQGEFKQPLEKNKLYQFSLSISLAEVSDLMIKEIGVYFSNNRVTNTTANNLNVQPQIKFRDTDFFSDTINWVKLEGKFIANGGEQYLTIGNFLNYQQTDTLRKPITDNPRNQSYYYIDGIETIDVTEEQAIGNVFTPNGDGVNDFWKLPTGLTDYEVLIYNRWGKQIIKANANNFEWNGKDKNTSDCVDGTYFYLINNKNNSTNTIKGFLQLIH